MDEQTLLYIGGGIASALVTALGVLWKIHVNETDKVSKRLDQTDQEHKQVLSEIGDLKHELGLQKGHALGLEKAHKDVLDVVRESVKR